MRYEDLLPWLYSRTTDGIRWGLERTETLLAGVGNPHRLFHSIHIAGTNGKGSVAALCDAALRAGGEHRVGLYTSPHLIDFSERIRIDGAPASEATILESVERLGPAIEASGATFFEATTAMAFEIFAREGVEIAVVEVGLGGRLDATNVLRPDVTGVTNVALDHADYLGSDLSAIAREKAGIFKSGIPAITAERNASILQVLRETASAAEAPFWHADDLVHVTEGEATSSGLRLEFETAAWGRSQLSTPLRGAHQRPNVQMAAALLSELPDALRPSAEALAGGFSDVHWPGRLQVEVIRGTTWVFDVAHNPAGAEALAEALPTMELPRPIVAVVGILSDKDWGSMLRTVAQVADALVLTVPPTAPASRRWNPEAAAETVRDMNTSIRVIPDLSDAVFRAGTLAPHGTILVTGSVHTVGDTMEILSLK